MSFNFFIYETEMITLCLYLCNRIKWDVTLNASWAHRRIQWMAHVQVWLEGTLPPFHQFFAWPLNWLRTPGEKIKTELAVRRAYSNPEAEVSLSYLGPAVVSHYTWSKSEVLKVPLWSLLLSQPLWSHILLTPSALATFFSVVLKHAKHPFHPGVFASNISFARNPFFKKKSVGLHPHCLPSPL